MMAPFPEKFCGLNTYRFYLCRYQATIKVDNRPFSAGLEGCLLRAGQPFVLGLRRHKAAKDFWAAVGLVRQNEDYLAKAFAPKK